MGNEYLESIFWSVLPISELRGGIPYAIQNGINPIVAYFMCVGINILVFPIVYLFLEFLHPLFNKVSFYQNLFDIIVVRTRKKLEGKIQKYGFFGIMVFVMIPLPVTGAYTGSLAAWIFNIPKKKAFISVVFGVIISGIIVTTIWLFGGELVQSLFTKEL